jgi:hypothetical protein
MEKALTGVLALIGEDNPEGADDRSNGKIETKAEPQSNDESSPVVPSDKGAHSPAVRQGRLGIRLDNHEWKVTRNGETADFSSKRTPWKIFKKLYDSHPGRVQAAELLDSLWDKGDTSIGTVYVHVKIVRELLEPLGLSVEGKRYHGYLLTDNLSQPSRRGAKKSRRRRSVRSSRDLRRF